MGDAGSGNGAVFIGVVLGFRVVLCFELILFWLDYTSY